jgi:UMF1 family MFS transporter
LTPSDAHGPGAILDVPPEGELGPQGDGPLTKGAVSWAVFEGARNPYVILITIYVFMPYFARFVVGDPVKGQEAVAAYGQYSGWIVMLTAPFLGSAIDKFGRRKGWLALIVGLMVPLIASLWFATPGGTGLSVTTVIIIATIIGVLFTYTEVLHNSLLIRAAGMGGAHKASALGLSLGNGASVAALLFVAWAFALPGHVDWGWVPKAPLFGLNPATHEPDRVVALLSAMVFAVGALPVFLFTPFAGVYATGVMKWGGLEMLFYGIILSILAVAGGFVGGWMDATIGPKKSVQISIGMSILGVIAFLGMAPDKIFYFWHFTPALHAKVWDGPFFTTWPDIIYLLIGFSNAVFITAHYASSRTLLTRLTPPDQTATFFGVYALSGTATVWLGSFLVNLGTHLTHSQQGGFATILGLLAVGFVGLLFVKGGGRRTT